MHNSNASLKHAEARALDPLGPGPQGVVVPTARTYLMLSTRFC